MKVFIIAAITADGYIARHKDELADWTSPEDKRIFRELTKQAGVIVMGGNTFRTIGRALPGRRNIVYSRGIISVEGVETTQLPPTELISQLKSEGCTALAVCGGQNIYEQFLQAGLVSDIYLTIEPIMFGGGIRLASEAPELRLKLLECRQLNDATLLLHYEVQK